MRHLENDELNNLGVELVSRPSVVFQLLIESSHGSKLQDDRERVDANPDQRNDVRMFQVD
jgi:hypothetical protein